MATLKIKSQTGTEVGSIAALPTVFEAEQNAVLVREVYNAFMTNQRQGTHSTKTRGFVSGGGKKPWKQKHTGRARQGSIRAPQWRHGAIIFGPLPRKYHEKINQKKSQGAFRSLLSAKLAAGEIHVVDAIALSAAPKTKEVIAFLKALGVTGKALILTKGVNAGLVRAGSNLEGSSANPTRIQVVEAVTIHEMLVADHVILTKEALESLQERLA